MPLERTLGRSHLVLQFSMHKSVLPQVCELLENRNSFIIQTYTFSLYIHPLCVQHHVALRMQKVLSKSLQISGEANMQICRCLFVRSVLSKVQ